MTNVLTHGDVLKAYGSVSDKEWAIGGLEDATVFAIAIEAAVLSKLAAGVSVEPDFTDCKVSGYIGPGRMCGQVIVGDKSCGNRTSPCENKVPYYTATAIAAARVAALEEAANPTDDQLVKGVKAMRLFVTHHSVADFKLGYVAAIRALIGKEST